MSFFLYIICLLIIKKSNSNIIFPFKIKNPPINNLEPINNNSFIHNFIFNTYYSEIEIGTPHQIIEAQISSQKYEVSLKEGSCYSSEYYNKKYSSSIVEKSHCQNYYIYNYYKEISINETISFEIYNNLLTSKNKFNLKNFPLLYFKQLSEKEINLIKYYGRKIQLYEDLYESIINPNGSSSFLESNKDGKACLSIGMGLSSSYSCLSNINFISYLYKNNIIKNANWAIHFFNEREKENNKYDGQFIIGDMPHEYFPKNYKIEQFLTSNALFYENSHYWQIYFNNIYFFPLDYKINSKINLDYLNKEIPEHKELIDKMINVGLNSNARFDFDIKVILGTSKYYDLINDHFFSKYSEKCEFKSEGEYGVFICEKDFDEKIFPSLYFYHKIYNYTFELSYKELFEEIDDKKYFLIVFDRKEKNLWKFGTIFFKKYLFTFNTKEETIGFYNNKLQTNNIFIIKYYNNIIWIILIIISLIVGFLLGKKIYYKLRIKRINELNDNFIYNSKKDQIISLEMSSKK